MWKNCCLSDKLWYCRLSPNHKVLHYGDVEENAEMPSIEALQEKSEKLVWLIYNELFLRTWPLCVCLFDKNKM